MGNADEHLRNLEAIVEFLESRGWVMSSGYGGMSGHWKRVREPGPYLPWEALELEAANDRKGGRKKRRACP